MFGFRNGVYVSGGRGAIVNQGTIRGRYDYGVFLGAGGAVTNSAGAQILGDAYGIYIAGGASTITNAGTVSGTSTTSAPWRLGSGGMVANTGTSAVIIGQGSGVNAENSPATVSNQGTISGMEWLRRGAGRWQRNELGHRQRYFRQI